MHRHFASTRYFVPLRWEMRRESLEASCRREYPVNSSDVLGFCNQMHHHDGNTNKASCRGSGLIYLDIEYGNTTDDHREIDKTIMLSLDH